jgi:hypothetical protein
VPAVVVEEFPSTRAQAREDVLEVGRGARCSAKCRRIERAASCGEEEYRRLMEDADRDVLEFIGDQGKMAQQVADRFPAFDIELLVRAELVRPHRTNPVRTQSRRTEPASDPAFYVLTSRGAEAIGLDPHTLHSD